MPFSVWGFYSTDREKHMLEEFVMIPGSSKQFIIARVSVIIAVYMMLFISSLPIISLSCIYSGLPWRKIIRLGIMLFICTFWSASVSIFSFSYCKKGIWAFAQNTVIEAVFILGTILGTEIMRTISISVSGMDNLAPITTSLCLLLSLINPLAAYMGYYGNITGDSVQPRLSPSFFIRQRVLCASLWELPFWLWQSGRWKSRQESSQTDKNAGIRVAASQ